MSTGIERKLTTILAADVEGYSRLMEIDEVAAMGMLKDSREVFARFIERHRGRIANTAGDGLLADFPSVVEAVQCAVEVQRELTARRYDPARAMRFRIGIHLGDVMVDRGDLFGEGVNLAARLQGMAEPGGVLISQAVYDQVRTKLSVGFEHLGQRRPKNSAERVTVYRLILGQEPATSRRAAEPGADAYRLEPEPATADGELRRRVTVHAQQLGIIWGALVLVDLSTGAYFWAFWPGLAMALVLALEAAPLVARGWIDVQVIRFTVIVAALAAINYATWSGEAWFLWPAGGLALVLLLRRTRRESGRRQA